MDNPWFHCSFKHVNWIVIRQLSRHLVVHLGSTISKALLGNIESRNPPRLNHPSLCLPGLVVIIPVKHIHEVGRSWRTSHRSTSLQFEHQQHSMIEYHLVNRKLAECTQVLNCWVSPISFDESDSFVLDDLQCIYVFLRCSSPQADQVRQFSHEEPICKKSPCLETCNSR